jgi:hypothetical protein
MEASPWIPGFCFGKLRFRVWVKIRGFCGTRVISRAVKGELGEPLSSSFSITPTVAQWFSHVRNVLAGDVRCFTLSPLPKRVTGKVTLSVIECGRASISHLIGLS